MKQILHILRKDVRHHWAEILASLIILAACFAEQPRQWAHKDSYSPVIGFFVGALPVLLFVSWAFLVERLVHGESLVGERQFWITRPYEWPKLLGAKLLGILLFIHLPLFLAQIALLAYGHFPVGSAILPLLSFHLALGLLLIVPMMAVSAITVGTGSATLTLLGLLLVVIGMAVGFSMLPDAEVSLSVLDGAQEGIYVATSIGVTVWQHARRRSWPARYAVVGCAVVIALINLVPPRSALIAHAFPSASVANPSPAKFAFDDSLVFIRREDQALEFSRDQVQLELPLELTGLARDAVVTIWGAKLEFETSSGEHLSSRWQRVSTALIPGRTRVWPGITINRSLFDKLQSHAVQAHLTLALHVYRETGSTTMESQKKGFAIPGGARCTGNEFDGALRCFASLQQRKPELITADLPAPYCEGDEKRSGGPYADAPAAFINVPADSDPDFPLFPVRDFSITASRWKELQDESVTTPICPGTQLMFHTARFSYSNRVEINLGEVDVRDYVPSYPRTIRKRSGISEAPPPDSATWLFDEKPGYKE